MVSDIYCQGAEGKIYQRTFYGNPCIVKERCIKRYRHPELDERLVKKRIVTESRLMGKARRCGIESPIIYFIDLKRRQIWMEQVKGLTVCEFLNDPNTQSIYLCPVDMLLNLLGTALAKLHNNNLIHGDLTSSNLILKPLPIAPFVTVVFIDFGLSFVSCNDEDKAVDLYVIERAFNAAHPDFAKTQFSSLLEAYFKESQGQISINKRYREVQKRGRKRAAATG